jgi:c-di-GMP-binding flagellar brake protein YcgR
MQDKRQYVRVNVNTTVVYVVIKDGGPAFTALSRNISCGGLHLSFQRRVEPHIRIGMEIYLPHEDNPVKAAGEVVWQEEETPKNKGNLNTGVKFFDIDSSGKTRIARYVLDGLRRSRSGNKISFWQKLKLFFSI